MDAPTPSQADYRKQRNAGILWIALAFVPAIALWLAIFRLTPPLTGMDDPIARLVFALKCLCIAVLFSLVLGVECVAHERLRSPAFDPLSGFETRRMRVNLRYLQNTLEQFVIFAIALLGLAIYCDDGASMRAVTASAIVWTLARIAFWIGYHRSAALRGLGAPGLILTMLILLYVSARIGHDIAGMTGAITVLSLFSLAEAALFWWTRPLPGTD